jgi:hypothetical protein
MVLGVLASGGAEAARFAARMAERFPFLHPNRCECSAHCSVCGLLDWRFAACVEQPS